MYILLIEFNSLLMHFICVSLNL